jgi:Lysyl oxidase
MRKFLTLSVLALLTAAACVAVEKTTGASDQRSAGGSLAKAGAAMPDLTVDDDLGKQWVVRDENLAANFCSVIEGGVTPGVRRLLRFTVMTPNVGNADLVVGDPNDRVNDGLFEFATCHRHHHFRNYATYELIDAATGKVWRAAKRGFCMLDTDPAPASENSGTPPKAPQFRSCGAIGIPGNQGISAGWIDTYRFTLGGQYFVLDGGDGQAPVPPGTYIIRITANPPFTPQNGEVCPHRDSEGFCHMLPESNYGNNVGTATITIPAHPGREGHGPLAGSEVLKTEPVDDENRPTNKS